MMCEPAAATAAAVIAAAAVAVVVAVAKSLLLQLLRATRFALGAECYTALETH
jgi:hypothetical protein